MERGRQYGAGLNNYEEAVKSYQKAVDIYPSPLTLDALGYTQFLLGDPLIAIRTLDDAIELDPTYGLAYIHRGLVYYARLNYEDAAPDLEIGVFRVFPNVTHDNLYQETRSKTASPFTLLG